MKRYQIGLAGLIIFSCLTTSLRAADPDVKVEPHDGKNTGSAASPSAGGSRPTADKLKVSEQFQELIKILEEQKDGATIVYNLKIEADKDLKSITLDSAKILDLKKQMEGIKGYAEKLLQCGESGGDDKVSVELLKSVNEFVTYLMDQKAVGKFDSKGTLNEKELNTFVVRIQKALEDKGTKFKDHIKEFEKADKDLNDQLVAVAKLLQGGSWDKTIVDEDKVTSDNVRKAIKDAGTEAKMCKLDQEAGGATGSTTTDSGQTGQPAPPVINPATGGAGTQVGGGQAGVGGQTADPSFANNQLRELIDSLRRVQDERDRERELSDEFLRQQLAQNNLNNDQTIRALQGALNSAQRPNVSRGNSDRSEQGPQLSPSVSVPQAQQQPLQQMQPLQMPPPMPFNPLMNSGGPQPPIMPYTPSRFNDDVPRPPVAPQPDPTTAALLQTMQQQNQMFQQMMMSRYPYMGNGVQNINGAGTIGQAFQNFGGMRYSRGAASAGPRLLPSRFRGNARGGVQGRMSLNPSGRGSIPSRLR